MPALVPSLSKVGVEILLEPGAGEQAGFRDSAYEERGARLADDRRDVFAKADIVLRVHGLGDPDANGFEPLHSGQTLVGLLDPLGAPEKILGLAEQGVTAFALELLPRISRAQPMDVLSAMATVAGYKAVLLAAAELTKMVPMMITAAGTMAPARVLVLGAGVAGLQAIAVSHRLGGVVQAYDVRPAVREQVESLGARFVDLELVASDAEGAGGYAQALGEEFYERQRRLLSTVVAQSDAVITTAAVPGQRSPLLISASMVQEMAPGSVIVDLAAEGGGNCELTQPGERVEAHGVVVLGPLNLPSTVPCHASQMYGKNITAFLTNMMQDGDLAMDLNDPVIRDTLLTCDGSVVHRRVRELLDLP